MTYKGNPAAVMSEIFLPALILIAGLYMTSL